MSSDLTWALGAIIALACAIGAGFYNIWSMAKSSSKELNDLNNKLSDEISNLEDKLSNKVDDLHSRINNTNERFVRREDLNGHMTNIENTLKSMQQEQRATNGRIDQFITLMAASVKNNH